MRLFAFHFGERSFGIFFLIHFLVYYLMDSDPDIEFIEKDSGMSSLGGSKDETPERRAVIVRIEHIVVWRHFSMALSFSPMDSRLIDFSNNFF